MSYVRDEYAKDPPLTKTYIELDRSTYERKATFLINDGLCLTASLKSSGDLICRPTRGGLCVVR